MEVISVEGLSKDYRQHFWTPLRRVLHSVSFQVHQGEVFGFLGPNGSGKSTTIKILLGIIFATHGSAKLFGKGLENKEARRRIGFLPENPYFYDYLTSTQFLEFHGRLEGLDHARLRRRIPEVMEMVGMKGTEDMLLRSFSKGMLQRMGLAQAILHDPDLVILDEPMTGLDPVGRKEVRDLMVQLRDLGKTVFFSTHILSDVETICDRVAILNKGKLLQLGTLNELISPELKYIDLVWGLHSLELAKYFEELGAKVSKSTGVLYCQMHPRSGETSAEFESRMNEVVQKGLQMGGRLHSFSPKRENLEDVFVRQVGSIGNRV